MFLNLMAKQNLFIAALLGLCSINIASAQTEHYAGIAVSNVIGPSYTLRHNRWSVVADAGWLTGFNGVYASVGGMYGLVNLDDMNRVQKFFKMPNRPNNGDDMQVSMGLGVFAQDYYNPSARQRRWADELSYMAPSGLNLMVGFCFRSGALPDWNFAWRFRSPVYFTTREQEHAYSKSSIMLLATYQIVVQRKF